MNQYQAATVRQDRRGQHYAAEKARIQKTLQLSAEVKGARSVFTKRLKKMLVGK